ncbi:tetratricopeptide repeat protein [Bacillus taeanensis]|uniref:tetratricopeptide repeat protein n=1 Tax=Bacillus taeanensis TaxID=273032 RepID=UPI001FE39D2C|nr:tetratricopeptide repeat protein [Bacillus taeanensis]
MNTKIGRNDPCLCGSGKKYKKCCAKSKVVSIDRLVDHELMVLQTDILGYAFHHYEEDLAELTEELLEEYDIPDEVTEIFVFHCSLWAIATLPFHNGTILEEYITNHAASIKRPKVRELLKAWTKPSPSALRVLKDEGNGMFLMKHLFTEKQEHVKILEEEHYPKEGSMILGILVPFHDQTTFFTTFIDFPLEEADSIEPYLLRLLETSEEIPSAEAWLFGDFPDVLYEALIGSTIHLVMENIEWEKESYREVIELLKKEMRTEQFGEEFTQTAIMLWLRYCEKRKPTIRNPRLYAAGLQYLLYTITNPLGESSVSQKDLGKQYGVSASSVSTKFREIEDVLEDELLELHEALWEVDLEETRPSPVPIERLRMEQEMRAIQQEIENRDFASVEEINNYLNQRKSNPTSMKMTGSKRDQAQELLYEAYEAPETSQVELAKKALELYPNSPDAYILLGEHADSPSKALECYEKAVEAGEQDLGKTFFNENKGHFWGLIETRPYMRAKLMAAQALWNRGDITKALQHYQDMLELNPNDNQGVRYLLLHAYLKLERADQAEALFAQYKDDYTAHFLYNRILVSYMKNGITSKLSKLLKEAQKQNAFVLPYLLKQKQIPADSFNYVGFGDETEAAAYAQEHALIWWRETELLDYIKQQTHDKKGTKIQKK